MLFITSCSKEPSEPEQLIPLDLEWITIPEGEFTRGENDELIQIDYQYRIMKYEVTNLQYIEYLTGALNKGKISLTSGGVEGYFEDAHIAGADYLFYNFNGNTKNINVGKISWNGEKFIVTAGYENHPVVFVTYYGAAAYAEYYNLTLPTEDEWEKAARGNTG